MDATTQTISWIGRSVGDRSRYRITNHIGGGGMGNVFLALDTLLGQQVAVKLIKERFLAESKIRQRFEREVLLCAAIHSDNVVQVKDFGITADGYPFYVMEYLRGQTLGQLLQKENQIPIERTVNIISQICEGLHSAHTGVEVWHEDTRTNEPVKVVHRDLKPENIFLVHTTIGELVKILDFGIAKAFCNDITATNTGLFMGTFKYAAPEQLEGSKSLDARADIYSLGMILYEMLSGTDPFGYGTEAYTGMRWIRAHTSEPPHLLRSQPGCEHISAKLEAVVMQCLRKAPSGRFSSVTELSHGLQDAAPSKVLGYTAPIVDKQIDLETRQLQLRTTAVAPPVMPLTISDPQWQKKVELVLVEYIGPIASIMMQQAIAKFDSGSDNLQALVQGFVPHIPPKQQAEFQQKMKLVLKDANLDPTPTVSVTSPKPISVAISPISPADSDLTPEFIGRCEQELAKVIGPMAKLIMQKALNQNPNSKTNLVNLIAQPLTAPQSAQLRQQIQNFL
jgi:eukaryotic-like serine/threonine-protein kinase